MNGSKAKDGINAIEAMLEERMNEVQQEMDELDEEHEAKTEAWQEGEKGRANREKFVRLESLRDLYQEAVDATQELYSKVGDAVDAETG
jgi:hypothetical protein